MSELENQQGCVTVTIQIGNSDDKLSQQEWSAFVSNMHEIVIDSAKVIHFFGGSATYARWQNVCFVAEVFENRLQTLRNEITRIRSQSRQDSVAIVVGNVEMI